MTKTAIRIFYIALFLNFFMIFTVFAEDSSPDGEKGIVKKVPDQEFIETITVTAQKRQENIQKIPMSISAFSSTQIKDADIRDVRDITLLTPNVHMKSGASANVLIFRGISNDADFIHSTASIYVDDICYSMNFMHNPNLFDIERIEVLRGPQGTLYGRNSESGVINIATRQPGNDLSARVYSDIAVYNPHHGTSMSYTTGISLSGPIIEDVLYMGIAGEAETSDGFISNTFTGNDKAGSVDHKNARWTTRWTASGLYARADLIMANEYFSDAQNTQKLNGKTLVNLRTGYEGNNYDVILWCKNLFNEEYQTMGFARKFDQVVDSDPRMFGITLTYYF